MFLNFVTGIQVRVTQASQGAHIEQPGHLQPGCQSDCPDVVIFAMTATLHPFGSIKNKPRTMVKSVVLATSGVDKAKTASTCNCQGSMLFNKLDINAIDRIPGMHLYHMG